MRFVVSALLLLSAAEAWGRMGGGQGFSGGGGSGGGGGGGGGNEALFDLLIWLVIRHPKIGIPLLIVVGAVMLYKKLRKGGNYASHHAPAPPPRPKGARANTAGLCKLDANFSEPLFIDFAQLVYARGHELRGRGKLDLARTFMTGSARKTLTTDGENLESVGEIIFGVTRIAKVRIQPRWTLLEVQFETNLTEVRDGTPTQLLCSERWTFRRRPAVLSPGPDGMRTLGCPSCGATAEPNTDGTCPNCDTPRMDGQVQWEVGGITKASRTPLTPPEMHLGGGVEPGTKLPTIRDSLLPARRRAFETRHPGHAWSAFNQRITTVFLRLQEAWATKKWDLARPYQTDALFQVHQFWMKRYARFGLTNRLEDVQIERIELVRLDLDAFYESVTVRIFAQMRDWTEDRTEKVVAGSKSDPRIFSEYWTLLRSVGAPGSTGDAPDPWLKDTCPSCAAPLDHINMAGICGYCDAKVTTGAFGWVLSRIEQDEMYGG